MGNFLIEAGAFLIAGIMLVIPVLCVCSIIFTWAPPIIGASSFMTILDYGFIMFLLNDAAQNDI